MKIQDLIFLIVFLGMIYLRKPRWAVMVGLFSLVLAMPLFYFWIFFTAQRLTMYAAGFFLLDIILYMTGILKKR